jgi:hypothetical protein
LDVTTFRGSGRRTAVLALVAVSAASAVALGSIGFGGGAVARADIGGTPVEVGALGCLTGLGGHRTVPAGSTIVIRNGWISTVFGSQRSFLDAQTSILSVNDGPMVDVSDAYTEPERAPDGRWVTWLRHPTGVTLASPGDSMRFTFALVSDRQVTDTSDLDGDGSIDPVVPGQAGLAFGGTCTVTAT